MKGMFTMHGMFACWNVGPALVSAECLAWKWYVLKYLALTNPGTNLSWRTCTKNNIGTKLCQNPASVGTGRPLISCFDLETNIKEFLFDLFVCVAIWGLMCCNLLFERMWRVNMKMNEHEENVSPHDLECQPKKPLQCIHPFPAPQIVNCSEHFAMRRQLLHNLLEARFVAFVGWNTAWPA